MWSQIERIADGGQAQLLQCVFCSESCRMRVDVPATAWRAKRSAVNLRFASPSIDRQLLPQTQCSCDFSAPACIRDFVHIKPAAGNPLQVQHSCWSAGRGCIRSAEAVTTARRICAHTDSAPRRGIRAERTAARDHPPRTFIAAVFASPKKIGSTCSMMSALTSRKLLLFSIGMRARLAPLSLATCSGSVSERKGLMFP